MKNLILAVMVFLGGLVSAQTISSDRVLSELENADAIKDISNGGEVLFSSPSTRMTDLEVAMTQYILNRFTSEPVQFDNKVKIDGESVIERVFMFEWISPLETEFHLFVAKAEGYDDDVSIIRFSNVKEL